jgi:small subunit ribosomal protein S18
MARGNERVPRRSPKDAIRRTKKKPCALCKAKVEWIDYKDVGMLRKYMSDRGKIRARRVTGNCTQHQRDVAMAIKTARELVLLPYTQRTTTERSGARGRGARGERPERPGGPGRPRGDEGTGEAEDELSGAEDAEGFEEVEEGDEAELAVDPTLDPDGPEVTEPAQIGEAAVASGDGAAADGVEPQSGSTSAGNGAGAGETTGNGA